MVVPRFHRTRGKSDETYALNFGGRLPDVYVALNDQRLNCQRQEREENHQDARARRVMRQVHRGCNSSRSAPFSVPIIDHPACQCAIILGAEGTLPEMWLAFHPNELRSLSSLCSTGGMKSCTTRIPECCIAAFPLMGKETTVGPRRRSDIASSPDAIWRLSVCYWANIQAMMLRYQISRVRSLVAAKYASFQKHCHTRASTRRIVPETRLHISRKQLAP
jgi:hypothetical protein